MDILDTDFVKPDPECSNCDHENDYTCFDCEESQVRDKHPKAVWIMSPIHPWEQFVWANKTQGD